MRPRTADVVLADFKELGNITVNDRKTPTAVFMDRWNTSIPYTPAQICEILQKQYSVPVNIRFASESNEEDIWIQINPAFSDNAVTNRFRFNVHEHAIDESWTDIHPDFQGKGFGTAGLRAKIEFSIAMVIDDLRLEAASDNGGYSWPAAGLYAKFSAMSSGEISALRSTLMGRLESVRNHISSSDYQTVLPLLEFSDKKALHRLAKLPITVPIPKEYSTRALVKGRIGQKLNRFHFPGKKEAGIDMKEEFEHISQTFRRAAAQKGFLSLPRYMLSGARFLIDLDVKDREQMDAIGAYKNGRWHTIVPVV